MTWPRTCSAIHPEFKVPCDRYISNHPEHSHYDGETVGFIDWPNTDYVAPPPRKGTREQQDARTRKKLREMAERTREAQAKPKFYPTENDRLGRTALYLIKYKGKWVSYEELEMKTVGGSAAKTNVSALINRYGWEIKTKIQGKDERQFVMLVSESGAQK